MHTLSDDVYATDWTRSHANFFRAVQIEKRVMFIILVLIVAVAAFNIVSTLVMAVTDKRADIAILRTLGAAPGEIMRIFIIQGALIGAVGMIAGVVGGVLLAANIEVVIPAIERALGIQFLVQGRVLHQRLAVRSASARRGRDRPDLVRAEFAGDDLSQPARIARESGRGAAL